MSGELLDFERGEPVPARARLEQLLEWVAPVAEEIGAAPFLAIPERNAPSARSRARGWGVAAGDLRRAGARIGADRVTDDLQAQIAQLKVDDILVGTASTLASVAYAKLESGDRDRRSARSTRSPRSSRCSRRTV
jgi:hypothetical protein